MNSKLTSGNQSFSSQTFAQRMLQVALAILAVTVVAAGITLWQRASTQPAATQPAAASTSAELSPGVNPELLVARRFAAGQGWLAYEADRNNPAFLAANPELLKTAPLAAAATGTGELAFLAENPELSAARRYAEQKAGE